YGTGRADAGETRRVVQRCEVGERLDLALDGVVDEGCAHEAGSAVHDPMPHGVDPVTLELGEHGDHRGRVIRHARAGHPDPLDDAIRVHRAVVDVEQAVLDRARAHVEHEDVADHCSPPAWIAVMASVPAWIAVIASVPAWIAVMAIVFTMSRTSAPREGSLMGFASPCSTGPIATAPAER